MPGSSEDLHLINTRFPHVAQHIAAHWGHAELGPYLKGLLGHVRTPDAPGFPKEVDSALAALLALHEEELRRREADMPPPHAHAAPAAGTHDSATQRALASNEHFRIVNSGFPHIGRRLMELWDTAGCAPYLQDLLCDTRDGTRHGFPHEVGTALFQLLQVHDQLHETAERSAGDTWSAIDGR